MPPAADEKTARASSPAEPAESTEPDDSTEPAESAGSTESESASTEPGTPRRREPPRAPRASPRRGKKASRAPQRSKKASRAPEETRAGLGPTGGPLARVLVKSGGRYRVQLSAFSGAGAALSRALANRGPSGAPEIAELRALVAAAGSSCDAELGRSAPAAETSTDEDSGPESRVSGAACPPDLLLAAAAAGATANPAFLDILDGGDFEPAPCLCCYVAGSARAAKKAADSLLLFQRYYDVGPFLRSRAYPRMVATLARDLRPEELSAAKAHLNRLGSATDETRAVNAHPSLLVAMPPCRPGTVWVYSTKTSRKMLRHLSRQYRGGSGCWSLSVSVASSDPAVHPRWRFRMYAATLHRAQGGRADQQSPPDLLADMLRWVAAMPLPPPPMPPPMPPPSEKQRASAPLACSSDQRWVRRGPPE